MSISKERDKRQAKVFMRWCNSHLKKKGRKLENIEKDFDDGVNLNLLYAIISSDESLLKRVRMKPRSRIETTANLSLVLQKINAFVKEVGIGLSYSPTQIADGDARSICGMLWILITKFVIPESEENLSAKRSLLRWVQRVTEPYDNVDVKNFHKSWKDGLAFNALLDQFDSTLMDYSKLDDSNPTKNCENAFDIAEKLGIYKLLDVEDITEVERPDEKSVMTYVSTMYQYFHANANKKLEQDVKNFVIDVRRLLKWIEESIKKHEIPEAWPETLEPCYELEKDAGTFNKVKAKYANYKCNLYVRLAGIQRIQRNERLKVFVPEDDSNLNTVHKNWQDLNMAVVKYTKELRDHIDKLEEEKRQREEADIKSKEDEERRKREEFMKKVEGEIKDREAEEAKTRDDESKFFDDNKESDIKKIDIYRDLKRQREEELQKRKEEEERKRRDAAFREEEAERKQKEEENRKAAEKSKLDRLEELKKREEEAKKREEEERIERAKFRERVDKEIKERELSEKEDRENENKFFDDDMQKQHDSIALQREILNRAKEELIIRDEQEKQKRADLERRKRAKERADALEEQKRKEEEARKQMEEKKKREDEEAAKEEEEASKARAEFRKKVDKEIDDYVAEEKKIQEDEENFLNDSISKDEEKEEIYNDLVSKRTAEHKLRDEQEKKKREDADRREKKRKNDEEEEKFRKSEEEERKRRDEEKKANDDEINNKLEEERKKREEERKKKEDDQLQKEDEERRKRKEERDNKYNSQKTKEQKERQVIGEYDVIAAEFMGWVIETQEKLTSHFEELEEDKEDLSTDPEIRKQRGEAVAEAKEKVKKVLEKWKELEEMNICEWSSIPKNEAVYAMETMSYALLGEESDNLEQIRKFKMEEEKKEE